MSAASILRFAHEAMTDPRGPQFFCEQSGSQVGPSTSARSERGRNPSCMAPT